MEGWRDGRMEGWRDGGTATLVWTVTHIRLNCFKTGYRSGRKSPGQTSSGDQRTYKMCFFFYQIK